MLPAILYEGLPSGPMSGILVSVRLLLLRLAWYLTIIPCAFVPSYSSLRFDLVDQVMTLRVTGKEQSSKHLPARDACDSLGTRFVFYIGVAAVSLPMWCWQPPLVLLLKPMKMCYMVHQHDLAHFVLALHVEL